LFDVEKLTTMQYKFQNKNECKYDTFINDCIIPEHQKSKPTLLFDE